MIRIGLTGSIGMGKSTTARLFAQAGIPISDSDAIVHALYAGEAVPLIEQSFPGTTHQGVIDRARLAKLLKDDPSRFSTLEALIHPLVRQKTEIFVETQRQKGEPYVVLDIPLLFEIGAQNRVDVIVVVTCDPEMQRQRVLARPAMTDEKFQMMVSRQISDADKRRQADYVIDTGHGIESAREQIALILNDLDKRSRSGEFDHA